MHQIKRADIRPVKKEKEMDNGKNKEKGKRNKLSKEEVLIESRFNEDVSFCTPIRL